MPKAAYDALMEQLSTLQATVDRLTAIIEEKNQIILNQNRARFGQSSEKRTYLLCDGQLSLFEQAGDGITQKSPDAMPTFRGNQIMLMTRSNSTLTENFPLRCR